jgi:hypothetical protein
MQWEPHSEELISLTWSLPNSISRLLNRPSVSCSHASFLLSTWHVFHASENLKKKGKENNVCQWNPHFKKTKNWTEYLATVSHILRRTHNNHPMQPCASVSLPNTCKCARHLQMSGDCMFSTKKQYTSDYVHGVTGLWLSHAPFRRKHNPVDGPLSLLCLSVLLYA